MTSWAEGASTGPLNETPFGIPVVPDVYRCVVRRRGHVPLEAPAMWRGRPTRTAHRGHRVTGPSPTVATSGGRWDPRASAAAAARQRKVIHEGRGPAVVQT